MAKKVKKPKIEYFNVPRGTKGQVLDMAPILEFIKEELLDKSNGKGEAAWIKASEFNEMFGLNAGKVKRHRKNGQTEEFESVNNKAVDLLRKENIGIRITRKGNETWVNFRKKLIKKKK